MKETMKERNKPPNNQMATCLFCDQAQNSDFKLLFSDFLEVLDAEVRCFCSPFLYLFELPL